MKNLILVDECRKLFPTNTRHMESGHDPHAPMQQWVGSRRSALIGLIVATQEITSAPGWIVDNASYIIGFAVMGESRKVLASVLNLTKAQYDHIDHMPQFGACIINDIRFPRRYIISIPPFKTEDVTRKEVTDIMKPWIDKMHADLKAKEQQALARCSQVLRQITCAKLTPESQRLLHIIADNVYLAKTKMKTLAGQSGIKQTQFNNGVDELLKCTLIIESKIGNSVFMPLTHNGYELLNYPKQKRVSGEHFKHTFICRQLKHHLDREGYKTTREYFRPRTPNEKIDVLAKKDGQQIAYEYINTAINMAANTVSKCIFNFNCDAVVIVGNTESDIRTIKEKIDIDPKLNNFWHRIDGRVFYKTIKDFF